MISSSLHPQVQPARRLHQEGSPHLLRESLFPPLRISDTRPLSGDLQGRTPHLKTRLETEFKTRFETGFETEFETEFKTGITARITTRVTTGFKTRVKTFLLDL